MVWSNKGANEKQVLHELKSIYKAVKSNIFWFKEDCRMYGKPQAKVELANNLNHDIRQIGSLIDKLLTDAEVYEVFERAKSNKNKEQKEKIKEEILDGEG